MLKEGLSGNQLKLIAAIAMVLDHTGYLIQTYGAAGLEVFQTIGIVNISNLFRVVGRISFPIFAFLIVEGFYYTKNRKQYFMRMGIFALVAETSFDFFLTGQLWQWDYQNVIFTFFIAMVMLALLERKQGTMHLLFIIVCSGTVAWLLKTDYGFEGVVLVGILSQTRTSRKTQCILGFLWHISTAYSFFSMFGILSSFLLIDCYNGQQGKRKFRYLFYWFYPVHMLVLAGIFWMIT